MPMIRRHDVTAVIYFDEATDIMPPGVTKFIEDTNINADRRRHYVTRLSITP